MNQYIIRTERLLLRELSPLTYNSVLNSHDDEEIGKFFGYKTKQEVEEEKNRHKQGITMAGRSFCYFHLVSIQTSEVLGWCGYHTWFTKHQRAEIGYVLNNDNSKGKGFMTEAIQPVIKYGFEKLNLNRIEALIAPGNHPSIKLVKRLGFKQEGVMKEHYFKDNNFEDSIMFALLRKDKSL